MKHLSLNLEALEQRTLFSVAGADVIEFPPPEPGPGGGPHTAATDAFEKITLRSFNRGAEFFVKDELASGFPKAGEAAIAQGERFFFKISPNQEPT